MIKYYPTYLASTSDTTKLSFTVISDEFPVQLENVFIIVVRKSEGYYKETPCNTELVRKKIELTSNGDNYVIALPSSIEIQSAVKSCLKNKNDAVALKVDFATSSESSHEATIVNPNIMVPIYFENKSPLLDDSRVLGVQTNLIERSLTCDRKLVFTRSREISCVLNIKNISSVPMKLTVISTTEGRSKFESRLSDGQILQSSRKIMIPINFDTANYRFFENKVSENIVVSSISGEGTSETFSDSISFFYLPWYLLLLFGLILLIPVILKKFFLNKLTAYKNEK